MLEHVGQYVCTVGNRGAGFQMPGQPKDEGSQNSTRLGDGLDEHPQAH